MERLVANRLLGVAPVSPALRVPDRRGLQAIALAGLPRTGPFRLVRGREAMELAAAGARDALDRPLTGD